MGKEKQIEEIDELQMLLYEANHKKSVLDYCWLATEAYNAGYRKQEWISIDDRLPDILDSYLVVVKLKWETEWEYNVDVADFVLSDGYIDDVWNTLNDWDEGQECHVTHWMPLPEPPKMKGGAD